MKKLSRLTQEELKELIDYDPESGKAYWKERDVKWFKDGKIRTAEQEMNRWNLRHAGKEITNLNSQGHIQVRILGRLFLLHRLIWLREYGEWPENDIDHINGIRTDNRLCNLRSVSHRDNLRNRKKFRNNTSGQNGVNLHKNTDKWRAAIRNNKGKSIHLGLFNTFEEAVCARKAAEVEYGYHENHGRSQ